MTMKKRSMFYASAGLCAAAFLLLSCKKKPFQLPPVDVKVLAVAPQDVSATMEWVATTDAFIDARIHAQVSGNLLSQNFKEGTHVKKGALLFQIDPRPFQAAYDAAKALYDKASRDKERDVPLAAEAAISKQELDQAIAAYDQAKASLEQARLNLEFTRITSPIDGIVGVAKAQVGDLVGPNSGELTSVVQVDQIKVYFSLSEQQYLDYIKDAEERGDRTPVAREKRREAMDFSLVMADGSVYPRKGRFHSNDNQIDRNTGTFRVTLTFPNPDDVLRPGQFGRIRYSRVLHGVLAIPQEAVIEAQGAHQVAVIDGASVAHLRSVQLGDKAGAAVVVTDGLKPGERVVVEGTMKVADGARVNASPAAGPAAAAPAAPTRGPAVR